MLGTTDISTRRRADAKGFKSVQQLGLSGVNHVNL